MKHNSKIPPHPSVKCKARSGPNPRPAQPKMVDGTGIEVPPEIESVWSQKWKLEDLVRIAEQIKFTIKYERASGDKLFSALDQDSISSLVNRIKDEVKLAIPHAVCPECNGISSSDSCICKGRGYLSKFIWDTCVTPETKRITGRK